VSRHVAVVVPSLVGAGAERVAETLAREFARQAVVTVVTMEPRLSPRALRRLPDLPWADRVPAGCRHVHLPATGSGAVRFLRLAWRLGRLARRKRFDAVYSFLTWTNVLVAAARLPGGRYRHVASEHAMAESLRSDGRGLRALAAVLPLVYRLPDHVVVVSEAARASLAAAGLLRRPGRVTTIPNPVDADTVRRLAAGSAPPGLEVPPDGVDTVVVVGRLHVQKDHLTLFRAVARLPRCRLVVVGDGPLRSDLEAAAAGLGIAGRTVFTGALANPYPVMARADVVVLPSREEGFGLVAVEAAALGVPFVGSAVGGLREVCAVLGAPTFPAGDDAALAALLGEVLVRGGGVGSPAAVARFGPAATAARYLELTATAG
jgi:glycosyltransferase involved in cell wall biosynthesis